MYNNPQALVVMTPTQAFYWNNPEVFLSLAGFCFGLFIFLLTFFWLKGKVGSWWKSRKNKRNF